jgi:serine/threonine protein kinase
MLAPETVLQNRYRILRLLGQGGMGAVYEALDERLDTTVALKETLFTDERLRKQFEREARLLARMHHPALPRVSDHFAEGDGQFLVMQYIPGDDLSQMMARKQGPFPPDQVLTWGDQLLDALDYLHTQDPQIIHRDIKPQNLKLTGRGQIILLDFGLAKGQTGGVSVVTTSASIFGYTPNYAPLEQIQGLGTDARSDIYALSATLYHLMTGVKPPDALTRAAALVNGQPDPLAPAHEVAGVGPEVAGVLAKGMSQNRDQRYATAAGMRAALSGTGEVATLVGKTEAATVLFDRPATTLRDVPAYTAQTALKAGETTVVRPASGTGKRRIAPWAIGVAALVLIGVLFGGFYAYQHRNNSDLAAVPSNSPTQENVNTVNSTPSPTIQQATNEPTPGSSQSVEKIVIGNHPATANEPAKKAEKAAKNNQKAGDKRANPNDDEPEPNPEPVEQYPDVKIPPNVPGTPVPDISRQNRRGLRRFGGTTVRNLPDGTQIMTLPDGTRVVTMPNGTKRIFGPGQRLERKKGTP